MSAVQVVRTPDERFAQLPGFPYAPRYATLPEGLRMHYVDEGPADAETVLLLHGQPTWSLPVPHGGGPAWPSAGCGLSHPTSSGSAAPTSRWRARPTPYAATSNGWPSSSTPWVCTDITLVVQDWGGPIGLGLLGARPGLVRGVVASNTALHTAESGPGRAGWSGPATPTRTGPSPSPGRCSTTSA